ncbi:MAG: ABC transporter permease [candidate division NC10 bacterium]|nr:ABC transporter permease [candidate division NC10 bacterium]
MGKRIREIIRKEYYQTLRDPRSRLILFLPPLLQLIVFGYAVNLDVEHIRIAWMDLDHTSESRELLAHFSGSGRFRVTETPAREEEVRDLLDRGVVHAVVRVLPGFARDIRRGETAPIQILLDGTDSNTASIVSNYMVQIVGRSSNTIRGQQERTRMVAGTAERGKPANRRLPTLTAQTRVWFNANLLSRNYFVPAILVQILALVTQLLTAMAIVREKEIGTLEQLMVSPIKPVELILGKTLPFAVVGLVQMVLVTVIALLLFRVPFRGNFLMLLASSALFLMTTLGVGLFISTIAETQQQAMMSSFFFTMPAIMLSGFAFPINNMPIIIQYLTYLNPLRYFVEIVRGIFLKGTGLSVLWPQVTALGLFGIAILGISAMRFRKRLD